MNSQDQLLASVLHIFYTSGMQGLGKIPNVLDQNIYIDLAQAKESIAILEMLKDKTKNNLSPELEQTLHQFLSTLQLEMHTHEFQK